MISRTRIALLTLLAIGVLVLAWLGPATPPASARQCNPNYGWCRTEVSWYGPGFYNHPFACGGTYGYNVRGVAHRTLRCGTSVHVCHTRPTGVTRCIATKVIDRGPYVSGRDLDATARTARDLCGCWRPYTMKRNTIRWRVAR